MHVLFTYFVVLVLLLSFTACTSDKKDSTTTSVDSSTIILKPVLADTVATINAVNSNINTDSLPVHTLGEMVLNGRLTPGDNAFTFKLMDSLQTTNKESRRFYFTVFDKILDRADGALGEAIGDYALMYVKQNPGEFMEYTKGFTNERLDTWASQVGIEIYLSDNEGTEDYQNYSKAVISNCKGCNQATLQRLQQFNKMVLRTVKANMNAYDAKE